MTKPRPNSDYTLRGGVAAVAVILLLTLLSFIPPLEVCGVQLRRANILSEFISFESAEEAPALEEAPLEEIEIDWQEVNEVVADLQLPALDTARKVDYSFSWEVGERVAVSGEYTPLDRLEKGVEPRVPIEDFDTTGCSPMQRLYQKLACGRPVRIAFLGDSFVEGDILTADLREKLQDRFGGCGAGFAPMASPLTGFRRTVKTQAKGWTSHNIMQWQKADPDVQRSYTVAGWVCHPSAGASTRWQGSDARRHLDRFDVARIWFLSREKSRVEVEINDSIKRIFNIDGDESLRQIEVFCPAMKSLQFKVLEGTSGFTGHGAQFASDEGVVVDNFSVRSNNGRAIFWSSPALNARLQQLAPYDLVILQYGLNIMQQGVHNYTRYSQQVEQMVTYARQCFPGAAILVLGVSERWVKGEQGFAPMDALPSMLEWQRTAARHTGAAFWSTAEAMQALGGMDRFVQNGWAGKDYTHINYGGGRQVAYALYDALYAEVYKAWLEERERVVVRRNDASVLPHPEVDTLLFPMRVEPTMKLR